MSDTVSTHTASAKADRKRVKNGTANINAPRWRNGLFILPYLIFFVALLVIPMIWNIWLSLHRADAFSIGRFIGIGNYVRLFHDDVFLKSVWNTFYFVILSVPPLALIGLFLALALNRQTKTAAALRTFYFSSSVLSVTIVTLIWRIVFIGQFGLLATVYGWFDATPPAFLSDPDLVMIGIAIATVWWCIGLPMMLYLSALQQIPKVIYEAAALDNTSRWRMLWYITLPSIKRTIILVVIIQIVMQFQLFGQAKLMTLGGPNNESLPIVLFIYQMAFTRWDIGLGAAASEILFALILIAAMAQFIISRRKGDQE